MLLLYEAYLLILLQFLKNTKFLKLKAVDSWSLPSILDLVIAKVFILFYRVRKKSLNQN